MPSQNEAVPAVGVAAAVVPAGQAVQSDWPAVVNVFAAHVTAKAESMLAKPTMALKAPAAKTRRRAVLRRVT